MQILPTVSLAKDQELGLRKEQGSLQSQPNGFAVKLSQSASSQQLRDREDEAAGKRCSCNRETRDIQQPAARAAEPPAKASDSREPVSREAFSAVKQALRQAGVGQEELAELEKRFQEAENMDWQELAGEVWQLLQQMQELPAFQAMDAEALQHILSEIGLTQSDMADLAQAVRNDQPELWTAKLSQAFRDLAQARDGGELKSKIKALGEAMGLSKEDIARLKQLWGPHEKPSPERMQSALRFLFDQARNLQQSAQADDKGDQPGRSQLVNLLRHLEAASDEPGKPGQEKISRLIDALKQVAKSASEQSRQAEPQPGSQSKLKETSSEAIVQALQKGRAAARSETGEQTAAKSMQSPNVSEEQTLQHKSSQQQSQSFGDQPGKDRDRAWEALWNRIAKTTDEGGGLQDRGLGSLQQKMDGLLQESLGRESASSREALRHPEVRQGILRQVQSVILRGMGQGRQELTLKLHPPELGKLHVVLQVHQSQVSALIKTDSPDVTRALQHQLAGLQHNLEQQGLKVQKIDVQTQLAQQEQSGQQWFGEHGHNEAREQRERMEKRSWWQRWRGGPDTEDDILHPQEETLEHSATQGLSVIA